MAKPHTIIRITADELRDGEPFKRCPQCGILKSLNDFGLRLKKAAAAGGVDVLTTQSWCRSCRKPSAEGEHYDV